jgi:hypothetical protein
MMLDVTTIDAGATARESDCNAQTPAELFRALCTEPRIAFLDGRAAVPHAPRSVLAWNPVRALVSIASQEYAECLLKARAFLEAAQSP